MKKIIGVSIIIIYLTTHFFGISMLLISQGESMEPKIQGPCAIHTIHETDTYNEGDIVIAYTELFDKYDMLTHEIIKKYEEYDSSQSNYYIQDGEFIYLSEYTSYDLPQHHSPEDVEGETVYILQGTNNDYPDPVLFTEDQFIGKSGTTHFPIDFNLIC